MLKLKNVSKYYSSNEVVALGLRRINLEFELGEFVAVTGESGSGKSTLLNVISGLDTYEDGEMFINGEETSYFQVEDWENYRRQYIGFVFQNYNIIDSYSVYENVMIALKIQGYDKATRKERAIELIKKVGLESHLHHKASKLSGGQKQRAVIARALAKDCPVIVADEPTGNLDSESSEIIMSLLKEISQDKLVIVVTHNYEEVEDYATRRIRLFDGEVVEDKKLKKHTSPEVKQSIQSYFMNTWDLFTFSIRNLFRTPRRTIFSSVVFTFIVLIFTLTYGFFVMLINEAGGSDYNDIFGNVTDSRIIISKEDSTPFTASELATIKEIDDVLYVYDHDVVNDSMIYSYTIYNEGEDWAWIDSSPYFINPALTLRDSDITSGRLPENRNEVIVEANTGLTVGDTINLGFDSWLRYEEGQQEEAIEEQSQEFEVVGVTSTLRPFSWQGMLYFHIDFLNSDEVISNAYVSNDYNSPYELYYTADIGNIENRMYLTYYNIVLNDSLELNEIIADENWINNFEWEMKELHGEEWTRESDPDFYKDITISVFSESTFSSMNVDLQIKDYFTWEELETGTGLAAEYNLPLWSYETIVMHPTTYNALIDKDVYQGSVYVYSRHQALEVVKEIEDLGYNAIFPETIENPGGAIIRLILTVVFGGLMVGLLVLMYFITYLVLRNIQEAKKKDFLIFRSIGASKSSLNRVTNIELLTLTLFGILIVFLALFLNQQFSWIRQIANIMELFTVYNYLFLFFILYALSFLLGRRFNARIFNKSVITSLKAE